ncbi:MAG: NTP transferase domain-containing protein [Bacillus sp. (in: Bacteria)]|nr:NTP transferase domain-containing protein [Bacillus sp. (in: firmicutes)]
MKGIILAGGTGTRLLPYTKQINKHLLPVGKHPMIYWPLRTMEAAGLKNILIVTNPEHIRNFETVIKSLPLSNLHIKLIEQKEPKGIADALLQTEPYTWGEKLFVLLGDNIFTGNLKKSVNAFETSGKGAQIFLKKVEDPRRYGVAILDEKGVVQKVMEKPKEPASSLGITGIYLFDNNVYENIKQLKPSPRGELEITDLNNLYLVKACLSAQILEGVWLDAGTLPSLREANCVMREID